jgi:hypothetical protein
VVADQGDRPVGGLLGGAAVVGSADDPFGVTSADVAGVGEQVPAQLVHQYPPHTGVDPQPAEPAAADGIQDRRGNTRLGLVTRSLTAPRTRTAHPDISS